MTTALLGFAIGASFFALLGFVPLERCLSRLERSHRLGLERGVGLSDLPEPERRVQQRIVRLEPSEEEMTVPKRPSFLDQLANS